MNLKRSTTTTRPTRSPVPTLPAGWEVASSDGPASAVLSHPQALRLADHLQQTTRRPHFVRPVR